MKVIVYDIELGSVGKTPVQLVQDCASNDITEDELQEIACQMVAEFEESTGLHATFFAWKDEK